ncbi:MAG: coproporphyrinogen III oxidase family protein [Bryobacterales bacterium]|nr:coproporphyrinogen III oxidase family protein [Bryobacterales bacterium]
MTERQSSVLLEEETTAGSYFVSNYPPYRYWGPDHVPAVHEALARPPAPGTPLGLYHHIPFCRKRCHFCYFKVYTDKVASDVETYLDATIAELELYARQTFIGGRKPLFIYFGGGTPSFISTRQLTRLVEGMKRVLPWDEAEEVAFECEPGTLTEGKLTAIKELGMTRISLGIENFNDEILQLNGRAHLSKEIDRAYSFARSIGFPQINIDLIAGMMGETEENWRDCVRRVIEMAPECVTVYQMEVPYNTTIFKEMKVFGQTVAPVANWKTKRAWVRYAFAELERAGYTVTSAYTAVKDPARTKFVYRDALWRGADMVGLGVASFSHVGGTHFQNEHDWGPYLDCVNRGELPVFRALTPTHDERFIREFVLQMKLGRVEREYFARKFGADPVERFAEPLGKLRDEGFSEIGPGHIVLNRDGLLQVDRLLHEFFLPEHRE